MTRAAVIAGISALAVAQLFLCANHPVAPSSDLGKGEASCRAGEPGPAIIVDVQGLKDRRGVLRMELYPPDDQDFLADDNILVNAGKTFRRVDQPLPATGPVELCMRLPEAGTYALALLHDRDGDMKFSAFSDGAGFAGNPKIGFSKPKARQALFVATPGVVRLNVRMNYWRGLSFGPLAHAD